MALSAIRWVTDRETGDFKGCGFAEFASTEDADQAFLKQGQLLPCPHRVAARAAHDWAEDKPGGAGMVIVPSNTKFLST